MTTGWALRYMKRELRGALGRAALFVVCLSIGVAAIVVVAGLANGFERGVATESKRLTGGDIAISGYDATPESLDQLLAESFGIDSRVDTMQTVTMASVVGPASDGRPAPTGRNAVLSRIVSLKVVDGPYPLFGELELREHATLGEALSASMVVVAPELLDQFGMRIGDQLQVGMTRLTVADVVEKEPDRFDFQFSLGPRVLMNQAAWEASRLGSFGSRVRHETLLRLAGPVDKARAREVADQLREQMENASYYEFETFANAEERVAKAVDRVERFLALVALLSLLAGGIGVAQTVRAWLMGRMDAIATLRCLGLRPREVLWLYGGQAMLLGLAGSALGAVLGVIAQALAPSVLSDVLPREWIVLWSWGTVLAVVQGMLLGVGVAVLFSLPPLLAVRRVPPVRVMRQSAEPVKASKLGTLVVAALVLGGVFTAAYVQGREMEVATWFTIGVAVAVLALALGGWIVTRVVRALPRELAGLIGRVWLRYGLASLGRPGADTMAGIVALGLGVFVVLGMWLTETQLARQIESQIPLDAPTVFLIDVQPAQWEGVEAVLAEHGAENAQAVPIVVARISRVNDTPVEELVDESAGRRERWALTREQRLTYRPDLPPSNEVVRWARDEPVPEPAADEFTQGPSLWCVPDVDEVSIEREFADRLGVKVGGTVEVNVQGVPMELTVSSIREVDWRSFGLNFFMLVEPGVLEDAPQTRVVSARVSAEAEQSVQNALARQYPNVTMIRTRQVIAGIVDVLGKLTMGVRMLGGFTVIAGIVILAGAIGAGAMRRAKEVALLKTLGMTRRGVVLTLGTEYALMGLVAGVIGVAGANVLSWAVLEKQMEMGWSFSVVDSVAGLVLCVVLTVVAGLVASVQPLRQRPIEVLRHV